MKTVYQNQVVTFAVAVYGPGGAPLAAALSAATMTVSGGSPVTAAVSGQTLTATVPAGAALGAGTLVWAWTQAAGGVTTQETYTEAVTVQAGGSGGGSPLLLSVPIPLSVAGAFFLGIPGDSASVTLTAPDGVTTAYTGPGVPVTEAYPLDPDETTGDADSPGEVEGFLFTPGPLAGGVYAASAALSVGGAAVSLSFLVSAGVRSDVLYEFGPPSGYPGDADAPYTDGGALYVPVLSAVAAATGAAHDPASDAPVFTFTDGLGALTASAWPFCAGSVVSVGGVSYATCQPPTAIAPSGQGAALVYLGKQAAGVVLIA